MASYATLLPVPRQPAAFEEANVPSLISPPTFDAAATAVDHVRAGFPARDAALIAIATAVAAGQVLTDAQRRDVRNAADQAEDQATFDQVHDFDRSRMRA